ncbi:MAG: hypothetical protein ACE5FN_01905 [Leptospirillia bacterium]
MAGRKLTFEELKWELYDGIREGGRPWPVFMAFLIALSIFTSVLVSFPLWGERKEYSFLTPAFNFDQRPFFLTPSIIGDQKYVGVNRTTLASCVTETPDPACVQALTSNQAPWFDGGYVLTVLWVLLVVITLYFVAARCPTYYE